MVRNSLYLLLSNGLQAGLGFVFWVAAARIFTAPEVGRATSLVSATTIIGFVALLGLGSTLIRYLPSSSNRDVLITTALVVVGSVGALLALGYVAALPVIAPALEFVAHRPLFVISFAVLSATAALNMATDSIFIAYRRAGLNALVDGGIGGVVKLLLIPVVAGSGAYGLYCASAAGFAAAAVAAAVLIWTQLHIRPRLHGAVAALRPLLRFSGAAYLGNCFTLAPILVVPLIVLDRLGASSAAYYFVAYQVASLLYAIGYAVAQNFLAEGAHGEETLARLMVRSARVLAMMTVPACVVVAVGAPLILTLFGRPYASHGSVALIVMAVAAIPVAAQNWLNTVFRLSGHLLALSLINGVYAVAICVLAWVLAPHGLALVGAAWLVGSLLAVVGGAATLVMVTRRGAVLA
jgi:O-antigen/teichoic acid export membrane protein